MQDKVFHNQDVEVINMVNQGVAEHRQAAQRIRENSYSWAEVGRRARRQAQLRRVGFTMARVVPGLLFLGAIPRGWMNPVFALLMAMASFVWAANYYRRGYRYE